jgi:hypothetical protein
MMRVRLDDYGYNAWIRGSDFEKGSLVILSVPKTNARKEKVKKAQRNNEGCLGGSTGLIGCQPVLR